AIGTLENSVIDITDIVVDGDVYGGGRGGIDGDHARRQPREPRVDGRPARRSVRRLEESSRRARVHNGGRTGIDRESVDDDLRSAVQAAIGGSPALAAISAL